MSLTKSSRKRIWGREWRQQHSFSVSESLQNTEQPCSKTKNSHIYYNKTRWQGIPTNPKCKQVRTNHPESKDRHGINICTEERRSDEGGIWGSWEQENLNQPISSHWKVQRPNLRPEAETERSFVLSKTRAHVRAEAAGAVWPQRSQNRPDLKNRQGFILRRNCWEQNRNWAGEGQGDKEREDQTKRGRGTSQDTP